MAFGRKVKPAGYARSGERLAVTIPATARLPAGERLPIMIEDLSLSGFRAAIPLALQAGMLLRIGLPTGRSPHAIVVRTEGDRVGCQFLAPLDPAELSVLTAE